MADITGTHRLSFSLAPPTSWKDGTEGKIEQLEVYGKTQKETTQGTRKMWLRSLPAAFSVPAMSAGSQPPLIPVPGDPVPSEF